MARVFLTTATPDGEFGRAAYDAMRARAAADRIGRHHVTEAPDEADLLLFMEYTDGDPFQDRLRRHPLVRRYRSRCFCISERDHVFPFLPGVYTSVEARWHRPSRTRSGFYLVMHQNPFITHEPPPERHALLYSFVGSLYTHEVRRELSTLEHPRGLVLDRSREYLAPTPDEQASLQKDYADTLRRSAFVLCPRGFAPLSSRLFESMRAGRVPVVISDAWVPLEGPDWPSFSLQVAERDVRRIPALLAEREGDAAAMGEAARQAWETWLADDVSFDHLVELCLSIRRSRPVPEAVLRLTTFAQLVRQPYRFNYVRSRQERYRKTGRLSL